MSKANKILLILIIVLVVVLGGVLYWQLGMKKSYYAVYLSTGDIYFGELVKFPKLALRNVWFLQKSGSGEQTSLQLSEFKKAFWEPEDEMYLNPKVVVWMAKLKDDSQIIKAIENPQAMPSATTNNIPASAGNTLNPNSTSTR